jgi:hypothetical protein
VIEGIPEFAESLSSAVGESAGSFFDFQTAIAVVEGGAMMDTIDSLGVEPIYAVGAAGIAAAFAFLSTKGAGEGTSKAGAAMAKKKKKTETIDVSIPYDAAALLAYKEWRTEAAEGEKEFDTDLYTQFKDLYYEMAVAEVVMKVKSRNLSSFTGSVKKAAKPVLAAEKEDANEPFFLQTK